MPKGEKKYTATFSFAVEEEVGERLRQQCIERDIKPSEYLRRAITATVKNLDEWVDEQRKARV